jgi:tRNA(fMet)-specific endonuclease VapC
VGLIVDTSEFVNIERKGGEPKDIVQLYGSNELYGVSTMTIAELQHGVRRADGERRRSIRQQFLDNVLDSFPVYPMDVDIALRLGDLDAKLQMIGMKGQIPDLIIAATALQYGYDVATRNIDDFSRISGLRIAVPIAKI